jgi:hypothetical protein
MLLNIHILSVIYYLNFRDFQILRHPEKSDGEMIGKDE